MSLILIVDDEPHVRKIMKELLGNAGHECLDAENADVALEVMEKHPAAVAFCDVQMPGHDGLWLTAELRKRYPTTAVVLATGVSTVSPKVSMQAGVLAYLVKPFTKQALLRALEQSLEWHDSTVKTGPQPEDTGNKLDRWLESLDEMELRPDPRTIVQAPVVLEVFDVPPSLAPQQLLFRFLQVTADEVEYGRPAPRLSVWSVQEIVREPVEVSRQSHDSGSGKDLRVVGIVQEGDRRLLERRFQALRRHGLTTERGAAS